MKLSELNLYNFGNEFEIKGMIVGNSETSIAIPIESISNLSIIEDMDKEKWDKILYQMDTLEVLVNDPSHKDQKVVLRKSQRQIDLRIQWNVYRRSGYKCEYCGVDNVPLTIDHVIRWENLGQTLEDNLICACRNCNKVRGSMEFEDWLDSDYYKKIQIGNKSALLAFFEKAKQLPLRKFQRSR